MSEISLLSPGAEIARWAVLPRWAVFGKFPLYSEEFYMSELDNSFCKITIFFDTLFPFSYKKILIKLHF